LGISSASRRASKSSENHPKPLTGVITVKNEHEINEVEQSVQKADEKADENPNGESEFKLTVRKLEMPVRPRGVLAE
jgi:hypothetical protein